MNAVIRVSVLVSERLPRWQTETLRAIQRVRGVELHGVFACGALAQPARRAIADVLYDASDRLLFARIDDELALTATADAMAWQGVEFGDIAARMRDCDVVLSLVPLDFEALRDHLPSGVELWWVASTAAATGVQLPGREETLRGEAVTSIGIATFDAGTGGVRWQCAAHVATDARSAHRTQCAAAGKIPGLVEDALRDASAGKAGRSGPSAGASSPVGSRAATGVEDAGRIRAAGGDAGEVGIARGVAGIARRFLRDRWDERRSRESWGLAFALDPPNPFDPRKFERLIAPAGGLYADPFPVAHGDGFLVFLEQVRPGQSRGVISVIEIDAAGQPGEPEVVIEAPHHLSYPFVFQWADDWWMVPESADAGRVELWRCEAWPSRWRRERVLLDDLRAFDATLQEMDGAWWMFASVERGATPGFDELHVFRAQTPLGPFLRHPRNPVLRDVRCARPAGRIQRDGDYWIRPAQDCSRRYGGATVLRRIDRLDECGLLETAIGRIEPWADDVRATHTWNRAGALVVVDAVFRHRR